MINLSDISKHLPIYIIIILISGIGWLAIEFRTVIVTNRAYFQMMIVYQDSICERRLKVHQDQIRILRQQRDSLLLNKAHEKNK